jgi:hypothetical protein
MSLKFNSDQQRIEGSGKVATGSWVNASYQRVGTTITVVRVSHGFKTGEELYIDFTSGGATSGNYTITVVDDDSFTVVDTASGTITAGNTASYKVLRSINIQGDETVDIRTGTGNSERSSLIIKQDQLGDIRVGINNVNPEFELDVDGQIRTNRSIISDTAQIINLDIGTIVNPQLNLRAPNLTNFLDSDVTSPTYNQTFYPTADTPDLSDQSRRIATTDFVYRVATNDTGGRVYVSSTIGSDDNDGRSAARPLRTVKKAAQVAYGLQKAQPDPTDEYVSIIVSGGEYLEDNPISLPRNCSLIGDNLRRVIIRPQNADRHMIKASNETYINGVVFRDTLQNASDPNSTVISTWKYAFVFDDKQRLYYEPEVRQIPAQPGEKFRGENIFSVTFNSHTGTNADLVVGRIIKGATSGTYGTVTEVTFTGPVASPYSTGSVKVTVNSGDEDVFDIAERLFYAATLGAIITDLQNPSVSDNFAVVDRESLRPELEVLSNQIYQHTVDSEREILTFTSANAGTERLTVSSHGLYTGASVYYTDQGNTGGMPGLVNNTNSYVRVIDANTIELYDTWTNAVSTTTGTQGIRDITPGVQTGTHRLDSGKIQYESNEIYIERHGLETGDGLYYRADAMGAIGGLTTNSQYFAYVVDSHHIKLCATQADATSTNASGTPTPVVINLTSAGKGWQRFEVASKLLSIATVDTSLSTQQAYSGVKVVLASSDYHDYEVGQEVNIYGIPYSPIDLGQSATGTYTQSGNVIAVTITNVGGTEGAAIWANLVSLGEAGIYFDFTNGGAPSRSYHIESFSQNVGSASVDLTSGLCLGAGDYHSTQGTIRFALVAPDSATRSGSVVMNDNLGDLNGRKYITHRIERADGYSIEFIVRGSWSIFNSSYNPTGDQTVISASNYVLASLRNSPYTFTKTSFTHRYRDAAEAIKANQSFIAEEAYGYIKSHHTSSATAGSSITLKNGEVFASIAGNTRTGTYSVSGQIATVNVTFGHALWASNAYIFNFTGTTTDGSYTVADATSEFRFTIDLGASTWDGDAGTVTYTTPLPHITPKSRRVSDKAADAASLILANKTLIARGAVGTLQILDWKVDASDTTNITNLVNCTRETTPGTGTGSTGGFNIGPHIKFGSASNTTASFDTTDVDVPGNTAVLWYTIIRGDGTNGGDAPEVGEDLVFQYSTNAGVTWTTIGSVSYNNAQFVQLDSNYFTMPNGAKTPATRFRVSQTRVAETTGDNWGVALLGYDNTAIPVFPAGGAANCADDIEDFLQAVAYNITYGGNDQVYDAANYYVTGAHIVGEEDWSVVAFNRAKEMVSTIIRNEIIDDRWRHFAGMIFGTNNVPAQVTDSTITQDVISPACADVVSTIDTLFTILTNAIGSTAVPGNLNGVTRTYSDGDQQCIDDVVKVLKAYQYDLKYGGNSKTADAVNRYINTGAIQHITNEVNFSRQVFAYAYDLATKALRNNLDVGTFSQIVPVSNGSVTIDPAAGPACANVASSLLTLADAFDNALASSTAITSITYPDVLLTEQDSSLYTLPLLSDNLDLPIIEASPYIQNSSLISFLGGSGCEIDGNKVATPNVPRPGLKVDGQGNTVAQFEPQGKSMVASAFTIISFGGTAYNILNDGYTQLVSVFAIFCQDGILVQSGGYASVTNSASNFGTYSLRATGYRNEPYSFDVGTIQTVTNQVDGNGVPTGRQILRLGGTTLTNVPTEDYIIKIDGATNTNPAIEFFILETTLVSGAPGTQVTADCVVNTSLDITDTATSTQYSYSQGNLGSYLPGKTIKLHRPSVCNSSSHTWEFAGSGNTYAALPQNGGVGRGTAFEAAEEAYGQVYTSGTNEFGDFKVGNFVTIYNRTGAISFVGTVSISELSSIKIVGGNITITGFSSDDNLGGAFASDSILPTQAAVKDYISNNLGPYLNQPYSTNAVPSALVQLTSSGKINIDQIPALRPFNITSVASTVERLAIEDASAGDIAIETTSTTFNVAPSDVNTSTEEITITSHGLATGDALIYSQGTTNIGGIGNGNTYYVINVDASTIKLAISEANATAGTAIDLTTQGTGTQIFTTQGIAVSYILENDLDSQFLAFAPNSGYNFTAGDVLEGSSSTARGSVTSFEDGVVYKIDVVNGGSGYTSAPSVTIAAGSGTQATATSSITNGIVTAITVTNRGDGYFSQPTVAVAPPVSGTTAVAAASVEGRVYVDIANNIKFDAADFILDQALFTEGSGTYGQGGTTTLVVTENGHGLSNSDVIYLDFTSGTAASGFFAINLINANEYSVTTAIAATTAGNVNRKRVIDISREVNTSGANAANWTQLTSTNVDASNIVSGVIDSDRLASRGVANSNTFLRGDNSWEYALQSLKPATSDAMLVSGSITDSTYIESITIVNGGSGYTDGTYQNLVMAGGNIAITNDGVARATYIVSGGAITSATVTDSGTGYTADFGVTIPTELGGGNGASLTAIKGTVNRVYGNISLDVKKGDSLTSSASIYGNYGIFKFRKDVANQALANQGEGGFVVTANGEVSLDQGPGSGLNADKLDGNHAGYFEDAGSLLTGTIDPARLANTTYTISIDGVADRANRLLLNAATLTANPAPGGTAEGLQTHLRSNTAVSLSDGGTQVGVMTFRRNTTPASATQIGFTDNDNLWIRGNTGTGSTFGNWYKVWTSANDGPPDANNPSRGTGLGLDADLLDNYQGLWYQTPRNLVNIPLSKDTQDGGYLAHDALPEVLGTNKHVFENFYVDADGGKYDLIISGYHASAASGGNLSNGGTYTMYSDSGATNNIGTFVVDSTNGITEGTDNTGAIYTRVRGSATFTGNASSRSIYVMGPNPGSKWTVTSSNHITAGAAQIFGINDNAGGAGIELGRSTSSSVPTFDFRSSGQAGDYDVQLRVSGGTATNGQGTLRINAGDVTINGNTVWHSGNDGASSQLDARYLQGYQPSFSAGANTVALRNSSGALTVQQLTSTNGIFTNNSSTLSLGDTNGITLDKQGTNILGIKGKQSSNAGYIQFGNDTRYLGWDGTSFFYDTIHFRSGQIGVGTNNPSTALHIFKDRSASGDWMTLEVMDTYTRKIRFRESDSNSYGAFVGYDAQANVWFVEGNNNGTLSRDLTVGRGGGVTLSSGGTAKLAVGTNITVAAQIQSSVTTGTAPFTVASTTVVTNLNADLLDGYQATNLPYLSGTVNTWITSTDGQQRFYFNNNSHTYFRTGDDFFWRNDSDQTFASWDNGGRCHFHEPGNNNIQSTYRLQVTGDSGLNINASEALSSGQKTTVLRATGDKQWIDSYGIFKRNRQTVSENVTVANGDNCMSAGPITIQSGTTVTISSGGYWSIV